MPNISEYTKPVERVKRMSNNQIAKQIALRVKFHCPPDEWWDEEKERYIIPSSIPARNDLQGETES